jgi:hypothetical protein
VVGGGRGGCYRDGRFLRARKCSRAGAQGVGWTARLIPLRADGLIYAISMAMLDSARRGIQVPALARWLLGLGIAATLAANVAEVAQMSAKGTGTSGSDSVRYLSVDGATQRSTARQGDTLLIQ